MESYEEQAIEHSCHGSMETAQTNPDAYVSFAVQVETDDDSSTAQVEKAIVHSLKRAVVDAVAKTSCSGNSIVSSIFNPTFEKHASCEVTSQESRSCSIYSGSILVRYHQTITDPTLQSHEGAKQHNDIIHASLALIQDGIGNIQQDVNEFLQASDYSTRIVNIAYGAEDDVIDVFDEENEETSSDEDDATSSLDPPPSTTLAPTPPPTLARTPDPPPAPTPVSTPEPTFASTFGPSNAPQAMVVAGSTQMESSTQDSNSNTFLIVGSALGAVLLLLPLLCYCFCSCRRRNAARNKVHVPDDDGYQKSVHTSEDEVSLHQEAPPPPLQDTPPQGQHPAVFGISAATLSDNHQYRSQNCESRGLLFGKKKRQFSRSSSRDLDCSGGDDTLPVTNGGSSRRRPLFEMATDDDSLMGDEDALVFMEGLSRMEEALSTGNTQGVEFISAPPTSGGDSMIVIRQLLLQEQKRREQQQEQQQQGYRQEPEQPEEQGEEQILSPV